MVADDPARLRARRSCATRRRADPARGQRGEGLGRRHRAVVRVAASSPPTRRSSARRSSGAAQRRRRRDAAASRGAGASTSALRSWYNPTLDYKHYMVPGILVALVTMIGTLLTRAEHRAREGAGHARAAQRHADHARRSSSRRSCCRSGCSALIDLALGLLVGAVRLRRADARQPAAAVRVGGASTWSSRWRSASGSRRWSRRSSRRCS